MKTTPLLGALLVGAGLIVLVRLVLPGLGGAIGGALAAVIVVASLGVYYWRSRVKPYDRAGDDLYYLGLLLTLLSLIYALVLLFILADAGDAQARVNELIGYFGLALVSTMAGILGRILLQDASGDGIDPRHRGETTRSPGTSRRVRHEQGTVRSVETHGGPEVPQQEWHEPTLVAIDELPATASMLQLRRDLRAAADAFAHFTRVTLSHADHIKSHTQQLLNTTT